MTYSVRGHAKLKVKEVGGLAWEGLDKFVQREDETLLMLAVHPPNSGVAYVPGVWPKVFHNTPEARAAGLPGPVVATMDARSSAQYNPEQEGGGVSNYLVDDDRERREKLERERREAEAWEERRRQEEQQ